MRRATAAGLKAAQPRREAPLQERVRRARVRAVVQQDGPRHRRRAAKAQPQRAQEPMARAVPPAHQRAAAPEHLMISSCVSASSRQNQWMPQPQWAKTTSTQ